MACEDDLIMLGAPKDHLVLAPELLERIEITQLEHGPAVSFQLTPAGRDIFKDLTERYIGQAMPILLNGQIVSEPIVREAIAGGRGILTGLSAAQAEAVVAAIKRNQAPCHL